MEKFLETLRGWELFQQEALQNSLWQYTFLFLIVLGGIILSKVVDYIISTRLKRLTAKTRTPLDDIVIETMRKPLRAFIIVGSILLGLKIFEIPGETLKNLLWVLIGGAITYTLIKLIDVLALHLESKVKESESKLDDQLLPIIRKVLKLSIVIVGTLMILQNIGCNVWSFLAGLSIGGVALALASKETLANFFGSIVIFADRPFKVGDRIIVSGHDGPVESIGLRSTRIRTLNGTLVTIPNALLSTTPIDNISYRPTIKNLYKIGVTYDTGCEKMQRALEILREIFKNHPSTDNYWVYFNEFGSHSLNILVIHWCKHTAYQEFLKATEEINLEIMRHFEEEGIEFAFPTQTLHIKKDTPQ